MINMHDEEFSSLRILYDDSSTNVCLRYSSINNLIASFKNVSLLNEWLFTKKTINVQKINFFL